MKSGPAGLRFDSFAALFACQRDGPPVLLTLVVALAGLSEAPHRGSYRNETRRDQCLMD